mgnify:CR=1 FL=1
MLAQKTSPPRKLSWATSITMATGPISFQGPQERVKKMQTTKTTESELFSWSERRSQFCTIAHNSNFFWSSLDNLYYKWERKSSFLAALLQSGLVWSNLVWLSLVWFGLVWFGLVWFGLVWSNLVWPYKLNCIDTNDARDHLVRLRPV